MTQVPRTRAPNRRRPYRLRRPLCRFDLCEGCEKLITHHPALQDDVAAAIDAMTVASLILGGREWNAGCGNDRQVRRAFFVLTLRLRRLNASLSSSFAVQSMPSSPISSACRSELGLPDDNIAVRDGLFELREFLGLRFSGAVNRFDLSRDVAFEEISAERRVFPVLRRHVSLSSSSSLMNRMVASPVGFLGAPGDNFSACCWAISRMISARFWVSSIIRRHVSFAALVMAASAGVGWVAAASRVAGLLEALEFCLRCRPGEVSHEPAALTMSEGIIGV